MTTWAGLGCAGANVVPPTKSARLRTSCHERARLLGEGCAGRPVRPPMGGSPGRRRGGPRYARAASRGAAPAAAAASAAPQHDGVARRAPIQSPRTKCAALQAIPANPPSVYLALRAEASTHGPDPARNHAPISAPMLAAELETLAVAPQKRAFERPFPAPKTRRRRAETSPRNAPKTPTRGTRKRRGPGLVTLLL